MLVVVLDVQPVAMTTLQASYSDGLRKVKLGVVDRDECQRRMEETERCLAPAYTDTGTDTVTLVMSDTILSLSLTIIVSPGSEGRGSGCTPPGCVSGGRPATTPARATAAPRTSAGPRKAGHRLSSSHLRTLHTLHQIGAVAWGIECGNAVPAVYSSIAHAMCWVDWVGLRSSLSVLI